MRTLRRPQDALLEFHKEVPTPRPSQGTENTQLNYGQRIGEPRAFSSLNGGTDNMHATERYLGNESRMDVRVLENRTAEMQDVLSRYLPSLHKRACRYLGNSADAEDAVQDALLSAYKHLDQFKGEAQLSTWLTAIVTNCARMQLRKRPRQAHLSLDERFGEEHELCLADLLPADKPSPEDESRTAELHRNLQRFVAQLASVAQGIPVA